MCDAAASKPQSDDRFRTVAVSDFIPSLARIDPIGTDFIVSKKPVSAVVEHGPEKGAKHS